VANPSGENFNMPAYADAAATIRSNNLRESDTDIRRWSTSDLNPVREAVGLVRQNTL